MPKTEPVRKRDRARSDLAFIHSVLDEAMICHVGIEDEGHVYVQPFVFSRSGDTLYLHGSAANRMLRAISTGAKLCIEVTIVDGLVLAKSALHHSIEYRSVMIFGTGEKVESEEEKLEICAGLLDHIAEGRSQDARPPDEIELRKTIIVRVPIDPDQCSGKAREPGVNDLEEDLALPVWSGVIPISTAYGVPVPDESTRADSLELPGYLSSFPSVGAPGSVRDGSRRNFGT